MSTFFQKARDRATEAAQQFHQSVGNHSGGEGGSASTSANDGSNRSGLQRG